MLLTTLVVVLMLITVAFGTIYTAMVLAEKIFMSIFLDEDED